MASPFPADGDELFNVIRPSRIPCMWAIRKSVLAKESEYFQTLVSDRWGTVQEIQDGEITLKDDDDLALGVVLNKLAEASRPNLNVEPKEFSQAVGDDLIETGKSYPRYDNNFKKAVETYVIANKYKMSALQKVLAESTLIAILKQRFDGCTIPTYPFANNLLPRFHQRITDEYGDFPEDLYDVYCYAVARRMDRGLSIDHLIKHISSDTKLLGHLAQYLAKHVVDAFGNDRRLLGKLSSKLQLFHVQSCLSGKTTMRRNSIGRKITITGTMSRGKARTMTESRLASDDEL
jgi:hypothetical protein